MLLHNDTLVANARLRTEEVQHFHQVCESYWREQDIQVAPFTIFLADPRQI